MFGRKMTYEKETKRVIPFNELPYDEVITAYLDYTIYTQDEIFEIKNAANNRNLKNGKYIVNKNGLGPDYPYVVGMPECSDTLVYDKSNDRWILTDGMGNGWIR